MEKMKWVVALVPVLALLSCGDSAPSTTDCDPDWEDPNGEFACREDLPVSCDQAEDCFPTIEACEASGQCGEPPEMQP